MGPGTEFIWIPVTGAWWASNASRIPGFVPWRHPTELENGMQMQLTITSCIFPLNLNTWINGSIFASHDKVVYTSRRKGNTSSSNLFPLTVRQVKRFLWMCQHVQWPRAEFPIRWNTDDIMRVLCTDNFEAVNGVLWVKMNKKLQFKISDFGFKMKLPILKMSYRVGGCAERTPLHWCALLNPIVPQNYGTWVSASKNQIWMEPIQRKGDWCTQQGYLNFK